MRMMKRKFELENSGLSGKVSDFQTIQELLHSSLQPFFPIVLITLVLDYYPLLGQCFQRKLAPQNSTYFSHFSVNSSYLYCYDKAIDLYSKETGEYTNISWEFPRCFRWGLSAMEYDAKEKEIWFLSQGAEVLTFDVETGEKKKKWEAHFFSRELLFYKEDVYLLGEHEINVYKKKTGKLVREGIGLDISRTRQKTYAWFGFAIDSETETLYASTDPETLKQRRKIEAKEYRSFSGVRFVIWENEIFLLSEYEVGKPHYISVLA